MDTVTVKATDFRTNLTAYLRAASAQGQRVIVTSDGYPIAALVSLTDLAQLTSTDDGQP